MRENRDFVVPVNIHTLFARPVFLGLMIHYRVSYFLSFFYVLQKLKVQWCIGGKV